MNRPPASISHAGTAVSGEHRGARERAPARHADPPVDPTPDATARLPYVVLPIRVSADAALQTTDLAISGDLDIAFEDGLSGVFGGRF